MMIQGYTTPLPMDGHGDQPDASGGIAALSASFSLRMQSKQKRGYYNGESVGRKVLGVSRHQFQPMVLRHSGLEGIGKFPEISAAQTCCEVGYGRIQRQTGEGVEQTGRQHALRFIKPRQNLGARDGGNGRITAMIAQKSARCLDTVEMVDENHRIKQVDHRIHSSRTFGCQSRPSPFDQMPAVPAISD